jgi:hypothetical protein
MAPAYEGNFGPRKNQVLANYRAVLIRPFMKIPTSSTDPKIDQS